MQLLVFPSLAMSVASLRLALNEVRSRADPCVSTQRRTVPQVIAVCVDALLRQELGVAQHRSHAVVMGENRYRERLHVAVARFATGLDAKQFERSWTELVLELRGHMTEDTWFNVCDRSERHEMLLWPNGDITLVCAVTMSESEPLPDDSYVDEGDEDDSYDVDDVD